RHPGADWRPVASAGRGELRCSPCSTSRSVRTRWPTSAASARRCASTSLASTRWRRPGSRPRSSAPTAARASTSPRAGGPPTIPARCAHSMRRARRLRGSPRALRRRAGTVLDESKASREGARMTTVQISTGRLRGEGIAEGLRCLGIPYAPPPVDELRLREPAPVAAWEGERDATAFGPTAPKLPYAGPIGDILADTTIPGEEWLNLNVWTPSTDGEMRPVFVWIHGGALRNGSSSQPIYDG